MTGKNFSEYGKTAMAFLSEEEPADIDARVGQPTPTPKAMPTPKAAPENAAQKSTGAASLKKLDRRDIPKGFKLDPRFVETKSKRVQLVLQPSLFLKAKEKADALNMSFNEYASQALAAFVEKDDGEE